MAKDHGPSVKDDKQYEGLRKQGMSKSRAAAISNTPEASSKGGKRTGSQWSSQSVRAAGQVAAATAPRRPRPVARGARNRAERAREVAWARSSRRGHGQASRPRPRELIERRDGPAWVRGLPWKFLSTRLRAPGSVGAGAGRGIAAGASDSRRAGHSSTRYNRARRGEGMMVTAAIDPRSFDGMGLGVVVADQGTTNRIQLDGERDLAHQQALRKANREVLDGLMHHSRPPPVTARV